MEKSKQKIYLFERDKNIRWPPSRSDVNCLSIANRDGGGWYLLEVILLGRIIHDQRRLKCLTTNNAFEAMGEKKIKPANVARIPCF